MLAAVRLLVLATAVLLLSSTPVLSGSSCNKQGQFRQNLATGWSAAYSGSGPATADGLSDAHWKVTAPSSSSPAAAQICQQGDANFFYPSQGGNQWAANGPNSAWIAINCSSQQPGMDATYPFALHFQLPANIDLSTLAIEDGYLASDNYYKLRLNGVLLAETSNSLNYDQLNSFPSPPARAWKRGLNKLVLVNTDVGLWNGARLEGFVTGSCTS